MKIFTPDILRAIDARCVQEGISIQSLMGNAGRALASLVQTECADVEALVLIVGKGNNAGDAFALATCLKIPCHFYCLYEKAQCTASTQHYWTLCEQLSHVSIQSADVFRPELLSPRSWIVDALLGTGTRFPLAPEIVAMISRVNAVQCPILSIDIPSGLNAETGEASDSIVAEMTATLVALKPGLLLRDGPGVTGKLRVLDIQIPETIVKDFPSLDYTAFTEQDALMLRPLPSRLAHKTHFGKVLLVGGLDAYPGSIVLSSEAALRAGAGMVSVVTSEENEATFLNAVMRRKLPRDAKGALSQKIEPLLPLRDWANVAVIGPGLTRGMDGAYLYRLFFSDTWGARRFVIDADAIFLQSHLKLDYAPFDVVITPHMGEATLLAQAYAIPLPESPDSTEERIVFAQRLARTLKCTVLLKGLRTVVADSDGTRVSVNTSGTVALATAGSGDVLSGVIAAQMAQGLPSFEATCRAAFIHGRAVESFPCDARGVVADELPSLIRV